MNYFPGFDRKIWAHVWHYINMTIVPLIGDLVLHGALMVLIWHVGSQFHGQIEESIEMKKLENRVSALNATLKIKSQIGQEDLNRMVLREIMNTKLD